MTAYFPFHLFSAEFANNVEAEHFVFEQWEPEPPETASDAEYQAWEDRNPSWLLAMELEFYMDSDFVELANTNDKEYIQSLIYNKSEAKKVISIIPDNHTHLIIIGTGAIYGDRRARDGTQEIRSPEHTKTLNYLGEFNVEI